LNTCGHSPYITSSLTRGWVFHLQLLLALASAFILGSESRGTRDNILLSQIRDFPFSRLLQLAGLRWRFSTPPPHGSSLYSFGIDRITLSRNDSWSSLYSLCMDSTENTESNTHSLVACFTAVT
jgi:hypothetical protein